MKKLSIITMLMLVSFVMSAAGVIKPIVISGRVTCEGKGIANVMVTDGYQCVTTDKRGAYSLLPHYDARFVYISTPAGYLTQAEGTIPKFYQKLELNHITKYDFKLMKNPKDEARHLFVVEADVQAGKEEHWKLYAPIVDDYKELINQNQQVDVFGMNCGDIFWDSPKQSYNAYMQVAEKLDIPVYRSIGNHDMDCYGRSHETSFTTFENYFGPLRYSFNKGKAHYIVVDNNFFIGRDYFYIGYYDEATLRWIEQDLALVPEGTLVFLFSHIPLRKTENVRPFQYDYGVLGGETTNATSVLDLFKNFETHVITGHLHSNANLVYNERQMEHNTAAVCGIWWNGDMCVDGTPQGYGVYEVEDNHVKWYYKSAGHDKNYQFRAYPIGTRSEYPNDFIVNVWNWDKLWKVEWLENGKLAGCMTRFTGIDPYAERVCKEKQKTMQTWISAASTSHLFRATPTREGVAITIRVTDRFGNVYTHDLPK